MTQLINAVIPKHLSRADLFLMCYGWTDLIWLFINVILIRHYDGNLTLFSDICCFS